MRVFELPALADIAGDAGTVERHHPLQVVLGTIIDQEMRQPRSARRHQRQRRPQLLDHAMTSGSSQIIGRWRRLASLKACREVSCSFRGAFSDRGLIEV
jgi:hypothetical protein